MPDVVAFHIIMSLPIAVRCNICSMFEAFGIDICQTSVRYIKDDVEILLRLLTGESLDLK